MPTLYMKQPKKQVSLPIKAPIISERNTTLIEKLSGELKEANKALLRAKKKVEFFSRRHEGTPSCATATQYGSSIAVHLFNRSQDKYHQVRWEAAVKSITRRVAYLTKLIEMKSKR